MNTYNCVWCAAARMTCADFSPTGSLRCGRYGVPIRAIVEIKHIFQDYIDIYYFDSVKRILLANKAANRTYPYEFL